ncbi:acidic repeat-containing protein-like isoform X2 [Biomphalaria pfeifferi]|uniref:Acidic repeat-containing protein-like isoform X2 n=1 Tax=Biomphalaria pfeifferi TaxID=112525 RepID=A0AAD8B3T2_BIOPF|nr:acidic repeat-containing protein-like isoform X2 [Biomphalaria pfeifferi]
MINSNLSSKISTFMNSLPYNGYKQPTEPFKPKMSEAHDPQTSPVSGVSNSQSSSIPEEREKKIQDAVADCPKKDQHNKMKFISEFSVEDLKSAMESQSIDSHDKASVSEYDELLKELLNFIKILGKLTAIIVTTKERNKDHLGTGFLQRIQIKNNSDGSQTAVLTLTTAYHVFGVKETIKEEEKYKLAQDWKSMNVRARFFYDKPGDIGDEKKCLKLQNFRLLETDMEIDVDNDWCAIECEVKDTKLLPRVIDLKRYLQTYQEMQKTLFEMSKRTEYQKINLVVIVGHPHGQPKMVSIGRHYVTSNAIAKEVRSGQRWCRYYYDAPTCEASSGSPVFIFGQSITGFGYWFGHAHNHKKNVNEDNPVWKEVMEMNKNLKYLSQSTIGVEHIDSRN